MCAAVSLQKPPVAALLRGSGIQSGITATLGRKNASVIFQDVNTIALTSLSLSLGPQRIVLTNPDGESAALDAVFTAN